MAPGNYRHNHIRIAVEHWAARIAKTGAPPATGLLVNLALWPPLKPLLSSTSFTPLIARIIICIERLGIALQTIPDHSEIVIGRLLDRTEKTLGR